MPTDASQDIKTSAAATKKLAEALNITQKQAKEALKVMKDLGVTTQKTMKRTVKSITTTKGAMEDLTDDVGQLSGEIAKMHLEQSLKTTKAKELHDELTAINREIRNLSRAKTFEEKQKIMAGLRNRASNVKDELTDIKKASDFKMGFTKAAGWKGMFSEISKAPDLFGMMGNAAKGLGGMLGGVTKILGGWPMAILAGIKAFADVTLAADQFVKDQNKTFLRMRGPDIMTKDVEKQFKDFNNQIFKAGENIKVGLNVRDIQAFMESVAAAGANITNLNKGLTSYRDAVYVASKASKTLGMDLPWVGAKMAELLTDFRENIDEIDQTFVQVSFDAKKAGLSTDKFWNVLQNATASLTFWGIGLKGASKTMKAFSESQVGGAKDAQDAVQNMYDVFTGTDLSKAAATLQFAGTENVKKGFSKVINELEKKKIAIKSKIEVLQQTGDKEAIEKMNADLDANEAKIVEYTQALNSNAVDQVKYMGALSQDVEGQNAVPELLIEAIKTIAQGTSLQKISSGQLTAVMKGAEGALNINQKTTMMLVRLAHTAQAQLERLSKEDNKELQKLLNDGSPLANKLADIIKEDADGKTLLTEAQQGNEESLAILKKRLKSDRYVDKLTALNFKKEDASSTEMAQKSDDTFKKIVEQTLSMKEMMDMAKDEIQYRFASLGIFTGIAKGVNFIVGWLTKKDGSYQTEQQKVAEKQLQQEIKSSSDTALRDKMQIKGGKITADSQKDMTKYLVHAVEKLEDANEYESLMAEILSKGQKDPQTLQAGIDKLSTIQTKMNKKGNKMLAGQIAESQKRLTGVKDNADRKKQISELTALQSDNEKMMTDTTAQLTTNKTQLDKLKEISSANKETAEYTALMVESDPAAMKLLADKLEESGRELDKTAQSMGISASMKASALAAGKAAGGKYEKLEASVKRDVMSAAGYGGAGTTMAGGFHMAEGGIVTRPTRALIGEKRKPEAVIPLPTGPGAAGAGALGGKTIQINVTATEKDLAQRIANEVRAIIYKERIG